jgi:N6-L-threonylcarbamoyladenine synthase
MKKILKPIILAIETSCDETSIAVFKNKKLITNVISSQIKIHNLFGGVVPEIAARLHTENLYFVLSKVMNDLKKAKIDFNEINYIAYTEKPGLIGCLKIGQIIAETLSLFLNATLIKCNHLEAHIYATLIEKNLLIKKWVFPVLGLLISGGHTQLYLLKKDLDFITIGECLDDAIGEVFDKIGKLLGLGYPAGKKIDDLAEKSKNVYKFSLVSKIDKNDLNFSFSGIKTAAQKIILENKSNKNFQIIDFLASFQECIFSVLLNKLYKTLKIYNIKTIAVGGGVSANKFLRNKILSFLDSKQFKNLKVFFASFQYCTDNGAMIGALAYYKIKEMIKK